MTQLNRFLTMAVAGVMFALPVLAGSNSVNRVVELTNEQRKLYGLRPVTSNTALENAAYSHAVDQLERDYFSHVTPEGVTVTERVRKAGYTGQGGWENLYSGWGDGVESPEAAVQGWMNSPGHKEVLLDPRVEEIGVGVATNSKGKKIYVQNFGSRQ